MLKSVEWLEMSKELVGAQGENQVSEPLYEQFAGEVVVVYVEDTPVNMNFLTSDDLERYAVEREDLCQLACANLPNVLPKIERHGENGLYMITAGGDYEASLLLIDIWSNGQFPVQGELVAAIPNRDMLIVTGSEDAEGLARQQRIIDKMRDNSYPITNQRFVYRCGSFELFDEE